MKRQLNDNMRSADSTFDDEWYRTIFGKHPRRRIYQNGPAATIGNGNVVTLGVEKNSHKSYGQKIFVSTPLN
ncbi:hypothetical protein GJAV_G00004210 [Gymnothorax javanicus]|nr:hypothetical protein GJAV_G00004210 [Gymnothorax javanicus]